jgi:hypothetical protein
MNVVVVGTPAAAVPVTVTVLVPGVRPVPLIRPDEADGSVAGRTGATSSVDALPFRRAATWRRGRELVVRWARNQGRNWGRVPMRTWPSEVRAAPERQNLI